MSKKINVPKGYDKFKKVGQKYEVETGIFHNVATGRYVCRVLKDKRRQLLDGGTTLKDARAFRVMHSAKGSLKVISSTPTPKRVRDTKPTTSTPTPKSATKPTTSKTIKGFNIPKGMVFALPIIGTPADVVETLKQMQ